MKKVFLPILFIFFFLFLLYPLAFLLQGAFFIDTFQNGREQHVFSLQYFFLIFENPFYRECFTNSFWIALLTTLACLAITLPLAYLFQRYQFPLKQIFNTLLLLPLILPPFVGVIGLKQFLSRFGSLNLLLAKLELIDLQHPPDWFGSSGLAGIILLEVLHLYPILFLSIQAALANVDPSFRDAARNLGANNIQIFRTITLPLAMPGIFAGSSIIFVYAFTDLGVPLMFDFQTTIPTQIFNLVTQADNPIGYALVVLTLVIVSILFLTGKKLGHGNYAMMLRQPSHDDTIKLSPSIGWLSSIMVILLIFISCSPHLGVLIQSFSARWFLTILPNEWSSEHFREAFSNPATLISIKNSLVYATLSCGIDLILGIGIAYLLAREKMIGKSLLDALAMLPLALPGLVMAFAFFAAFSRPIFPEMWGVWAVQFNATWLALVDPRKNPTLLLIVAYAIHRLPYLVRAAYAGFQQTSISLEEASINMGATPLQTLFKITLPLISANLIAGTVITFAFAMLDVSNGMILAQEAQFFPVTKAIYSLMGRIVPTAPSIACALGVLAMLLLTASLFLASKLLGQKMGQLFKA